MWDLIVSGLGPAGSTAARIAAEAGLRVLAFDKAAFPRYKPCAAGLTGRTTKILPMKTDEYVELSINHALITMGSMSPVKVFNPDGLMVTTRRETLDTLLVEHAVNAGVVIRESCPMKLMDVSEKAVQVSTPHGTETGAFLIAADGANSSIARFLLNKHSPFLPSWEVEFEYDRSEQSEIVARFDLGIVPRGYGWSFPKLNTIAVGVAGKLSSRRAVDMAFKAMMDRLPGSEKWIPVISRGHPIPLYDPARRLAFGRVLLTGDAGCLIDPFLGEGIYHAIESGRIAAQCIENNIRASKSIENMNSEFLLAIDRKIGKELKLAGRLASVIYKFPGFMFRLTSRSPDVLTEFGLSLTEEEGYRAFAKKVGYPYKLLFIGCSLD